MSEAKGESKKKSGEKSKSTIHPTNAAPKPGLANGGRLYYKEEIGLSGWSQHVDDATGRTYYFSSQTQESTWVEPEEVKAARAIVGRGDEITSSSASLPRAVDSHLGKVFADDRRDSTAPRPTSIHEEAYVPVSFARKSLEEMGNGMKQAQTRFAKQTGQLIEYYGASEKEVNAHYIAFINGLKMKAVRRIGHYKAVLDRTVREASEYRKTAEETINSTQASNSRLLVEKAALLKQMQEEKRTMKTSHAKDMDELRASDEKEAEDRQKKAAAIANALKAESKDLIVVKNTVLSEVKAMQSEHQKNIDEVISILGRLKKTSAVPIVPAAESKSDVSATKSAAAPMGAGTDTLQTPRDIVDSAELEKLQRQLEAAKQVEAGLRQEIEANQAAALAAADDATEPSMVAPDDIDGLRKQLAAANRAKDSLLARNKSLENEVEASKIQVKEAEASAAKATSTAAEMANSATSSGGDDTGSSGVDSAKVKALEHEVKVLKVKLSQRNATAGSAEDKSSGDKLPEHLMSGESTHLETKLKEANSELAILREEVAALRASSEALSDENVEASKAHDEEMIEFARRQKELEKELDVARAASASTAEEDAASKSRGSSSDQSKENIHQKMRTCIEAGKELWAAGDKESCANMYLKCAEEVYELIGQDALGADILKTGIKKAKSKKRPPPRAALAIRKAFDQFLVTVPEPTTETSLTTSKSSNEKPHAQKVEALEKELKKLMEQKESSSLSNKRALAKKGEALERNARVLKSSLRACEAKIKILIKERDDALNAAKVAEQKAAKVAGSPSSKSAKDADEKKSSASDANMRKKVKELEKKLKEAGVKQRQMENKLEKAEKKAAAASGTDPAAQKALERRIKDMQNKNKKALDAAAADAERQLKEAERQTLKQKKRADEAEQRLADITEERDNLKKKVGSMTAMGKEIEELRVQAAEAAEAKKAAKAAEKVAEEMTRQYKEESVLRKRYWNMMEDMKGKIRVFCRTRPMSGSEKERKCQVCVDFPDEVSIGVTSEKGRKEFLFDQCFTPTASQEEVFEDASHLIQSAFDGFNVCVFAYGQTGSGKTFTMVGPPELPGLTPRAIGKIFDNKAALKGKNEINITCYMAELYNDQLVDLLWKHEMKIQHKKANDPPRLNIKKDSKGMVFIQGIVTKEVKSVEEAMGVFKLGNAARHIGSTKMNAESSRSHLIFALLIENRDLTTHKTSLGKLSLVDLAGSERVGKTGATKERLKEAQSINKSLSSLGDVISALSTGAKFIPYRNNKLTQLLSDGLGGNAKTLMFVNLSPADYNADETTTSLVYAARVKLIKNDAKKESDSEAVAHLKKIIHEFETEGRSATLENESKGGD